MNSIRLIIWTVNAFWIEVLTTLVVLAAIVLACSTACGQTYEITVRDRSNQVSKGSAVCVGRGLAQGQWVFLTAGHVLNGGHVATVEGHRVNNVRFARGKDLASFEIGSGEFEKTAIVKDWPDGINAQVCGFGAAREAFCFEGSITRYSEGGRIWARNQHTVPGDSGGAVMIQTGQRRCLAGVHWGYGCQAGRCDSEFVTSEQICQHLTQVYGDCPDCRQWPQVIQRPQQQRPQVLPQPRLPTPPSVVVAPCQDDIRRMVAEYMRANPVQSGRDGADGTDGRNGVDGRTPDVDYPRIVGSVLEAMPRPRDGVDGHPRRDGQSVSVSQVAEYLVANHRAEITGPAGLGQRGEQGPQGERGLIGVPDDQDIRNWLVGAMSDAETRAMMSQLLVELAAEDPRTTGLIQRLEALENRTRTQRVMIVDDQQNVLDDETFRDGEPIILNLRQLSTPQAIIQP